MANNITRSFWIINLNQYTPVLATADGTVVLEARFSLAEENADSGDRLRRLIKFIRSAKRQLDDRTPDLTPPFQFRVSHKVVEQIVYLSYWKDYRLEFRVEKAKNDIVIWARFPNKSELSCVLDEFADGCDSCDQLQGWWDFLCKMISDHADIWKIHLVINERVYEKLAVSQYPNVFVEVQTDESALVDDVLSAQYSTSSDLPC